MYYTNIVSANTRIKKLESEVLQLKGAMEYLERDKIPWLERELERERNRQWAKV